MLLCHTGAADERQRGRTSSVDSADENAGKTFRHRMTFYVMVKAFIMVKARTGQAEELSETLGEIEHVTEVNVVAGDFDIIVETEAEEVYDIINSVAARIRDLEEIEDTKTYICLE